jgi:hypothetical protein
MDRHTRKTEASPGLTRLDEDRAQSMADEGGASAATVEATGVRKRREHRGLPVLLALGSTFLAVLALARLARRA